MFSYRSVIPAVTLLLLLTNSCTERHIEPEPPQTDPDEYLVIPQDLQIPQKGGNQSFFLKSNTAWTGVSQNDWIVLFTDKGYKDGEVSLMIEPNSGVWKRSGQVVFSTEHFSDTLHVVQDASDIDIQRVDSQGPANCFIVSPKAKACSFEGLIPISSSEKISTVKLIWQDARSLIKHLEYDPEKNLIGFIPGDVSGNAVVAAADQNGEVLWSWHLWLTEYDPFEGSLTTAKNQSGTSWTYMDRNLGALSSVSGDFKSLGLIYQWGRKDPFPGNISEKETEPETYDIEGNVLPTTPQSAEQFGTVPLSIRHPYTFYKISYNTNDWTTPSDDDLWGGASLKKTAYDPCPAGWKVPVCDEEGNNPYEFILDGTAIWSDKPAGYFYGDSWFPCGGTRIYESGNLSYNINGGYGGLWIGTAGSANKDQITYPALYGQYLFLIDGILFNTSKDARSQGMSVRCVRE